MTEPIVHWLVEDGPFEEDIEPMLAEIRRQGHPLQMIKYQPFQSGNYTDLYPHNACVVFYGSINLATQLQRETPWIPGPMVTFDNYKCTSYYPYWGKYLFNDNYIMLPYGDFSRKRQEIASLFWGEIEFFIRPNDGRKSFGGHVVRWKEFEMKGGPVGDLIRPDNLIVVSDYKKMHNEWRFVIADKKVIAGTKYKSFDKLDIDPAYSKKAWDFAQKIADTEWQPDRLYVLDICNDYGDPESGLMFLLETNSFACSGFYACDPAPIVKEASRIALEEWREIWEIA